MVTQGLVKMKTFLFIFALIGAATALIPRNEYFYYYTAETNIGIPEINPTYSVVGIKCNVSIQVADSDRVIIQMNDFLVSTAIRRFKGGMNGYPEDPIRYSSVSGEAKALQEPFEVYLRKETGTVMIVPKTDKEWLTNIRKSIASILRVYPVVNIPTEMDAKRFIPHFSIKEHTIFGYCDSQYTIKNISHQFLPMPGGMHGPRSGYQICNQGAYNVTRSINFNKCSDMTLVQNTGLSNRSSAAHMNHGSIESRTSVAHYTVCGRSGHMQIQNMTTQGLFASNPFGYETEKMQAVTNQTFRLSYVRPLITPTKLKSTKEITTWLMEVASPFVRNSPNERPWINFYNDHTELYPYMSEAVMTGESYEGLKTPFKLYTLELIKKAAKILNSRPQPYKGMEPKLFDTPESEVPRDLQTMTRLIRSLDKRYLTDIWNALHKEPKSKYSITERILYTDALAASGSSAAISVLLDEMTKGSITDYRSRTLFMTLANNIVNPEILPELLKYVMKLRISENPYLTISAHVNLASAVRRVCTDTKISMYSIPRPILGNRRCSPTGILREYWNFLEKQLEASTKPFERAIWVEAIANLGSVKALPVIREVIAGHHGRNASIRVMGIYALLHYRIPDAPRHEISKILTPLYEDFMEDMQLRQTAILVLASWHPDNSFWQNLASLSWRDPSKEVGSFIYSLMTSTSKSTDPKLYKQGEYAKQALNRAKPYPPSFMYSYSYLWAKLSPSYHLTTEFAVSKISSNESVVPREVFSYLYNNHGGLDYTVLEQCAYAFNADELFFRILQKIHTFRSSAQRNPRLSKPNDYIDFYNIIKDELHFKGKDIFPYQLFYVIRLFDHMEYFAPVDRDIIDISNKHGEGVIDRLLKGTDIHLIKYFDPAPIEMYIPLESGLPMAYRLSYPIVISIIGYAKLKVPHVQNPNLIDLLTSPEVVFGMDKNAKYISTYIANVATIVPWEKREVYTETYMTTNINDPSQFNVTVINSISHDYVNTTLAFYVKPNIDREYPIIHSHNKPVVGLRSMWPDRKDEQIQELFVSPKKVAVESLIYGISKRFLGISGYLKYNSDIVYPYTAGSFYELLQHPQRIMRAHSPTSKRWDYELVVNPAESDTKSVNASFSIWVPTTILSMPLKNYTRVNEQKVDYTRDYPYGFTARAHLNGTVNRYYEASAGVAVMYDKMHYKNYSVRATLRRSELPGFSDQKEAFCVNMTIGSPKLFNFAELVYFMAKEKHVESRHEGQFYLGEQCQQSRLGDFHGHLKLSSEERSRISQAIGRHGQYTPYDPLEPFYDRKRLVVNYDNSRVQPFFRNMTYMLYDTIRGYAFPHVYFGYTNVNNAQNKIKIEARRLMKSHYWNGTVEMPTETARFESQQVLRHVYSVIPSAGISQLAYKCIITDRRVRTFDNVWYDLPAQHIRDCWTVAAINKKYPKRLQILIRRPSSGYEAVVSSSIHQMNVEVHKDKIMVNGKQIAVSDQAKWVYDQAGVPFAQVVSQWGRHEVSIPGNVTVSVSEKRIAIMPFKVLKGKVNGICGDFNSELENEMVGPENCYYQNATTFSNSWTIRHGDNCNRNYWNYDQSAVKNFQKSCAKAYPNALPFELMKEKNCEDYVYPIAKLHDVICVSTNSVGMCLPGCKEVKYIITSEYYYCYFYTDVPADVKPNLKRGYMTTFPETPPDVTQSIRTRSSFMCQ